jgi:hypothetical protein
LSSIIIIGFIWAIIVPGLNQFFFFRYPAVNITGTVAQLLSFPMGRLWAKIVPNWKIFGIPINPGPFTIKEHVLITIMATVGSQSAYAVCFRSLLFIISRSLAPTRPILLLSSESTTTKPSTSPVSNLEDRPFRYSKIKMQING